MLCSYNKTEITNIKKIEVTVRYNQQQSQQFLCNRQTARQTGNYRIYHACMHM